MLIDDVAQVVGQAKPNEGSHSFLSWNRSMFWNVYFLKFVKVFTLLKCILLYVKRIIFNTVFYVKITVKT